MLLQDSRWSHRPCLLEWRPVSLLRWKGQPCPAGAGYKAGRSCISFRKWTWLHMSLGSWHRDIV